MGGPVPEDQAPRCWLSWRSRSVPSEFAGAVAVLLLGTVGGCSEGDSDVAPSEASPVIVTHSGGAEGREIRLADGRKLFFECRGSGSPTVVLESGYHDSSDLWSETDATPPASAVDAFTQIASFTRVCRYDRPGTLRYVGDEPALTDRSTPVPMPRTAEDVVADLSEVLDLSGEPGPYVFVAHSLGGVFARLYAQTHPDEVSGLVFVDSFPIEVPSLFGDKWPAYREVLDAAGSQPSPYFEQVDLDASVAQVAAAGPLDPMLPMVVLTKTEAFQGLPADLKGFTADDLEGVWTEGAAALVALGSQTPHWFATGSDHYVQVRQPDLVAAATRLVMGRIGR